MEHINEKFREMKIGQAWLVKREGNLYLKVAFSEAVELIEIRAISVDVNENNVAFGSTVHVYLNVRYIDAENTSARYVESS